MITLLTFPSPSHPCDLVQGNFSIFFAWWDSLSATSNQNTRPCHVHDLCESDNTCSYCACWDFFSFFFGHFKDGSSLICISTYSSGMFKGVYCWLRAEQLAFLLPRSFFSPVQALFRQGPCSRWHGRYTSIRSAFFLYLAIIASSAFMKIWAKWTSLAMVWGSCS